MLSPEEFDNWCHCLNLTQSTISVIERVRASAPSRRVGGGRKNVSGRYPSQKMGVTIQFESHRVELPTIYEFETDEDVLEFYDQPPQIKLDYQAASGRKLGVLHTPDFFVIRTNSAGWEECKTEEDLKKLALKSPNRYQRDEEGFWHCPPGASYASAFGLYYCIRSDAQINWVLQRNTIFLEDYFRAESQVVESSQASVTKLVTATPGITLASLLQSDAGILADDIYTLIVTGELYVNLSTSLLAEPERTLVFRDRQTATAYGLMTQAQNENVGMSSPVINLTAGTKVSWDGKGLSMFHVGETEVALRGEDEQLIHLKKNLFFDLVKQGKIKSLETMLTPAISPEGWERFYKASPEDQAEALERYKVIEPYLNGHSRELETVSSRTIRDWKAKYLTAQAQQGCGYLGLLSHRSAKGNRNRKLPEDTLALMTKFLNEDYETIKQKKMWSVYCSLVRACEQCGTIAPSYKSFTFAVHERDNYEQTKKRRGHRAAYKQEPFYWELERTTPRHGDRPFEICHIDHTELDVELVCSRNGRHAGRPWATFLVDAYARRLLAVYITFDPPSYRSCLMVLRICVQRHGRLPQIVVVDNGAEFHSVYFETLLATFVCTKKNRPAAKGRFGSVCERLFGTSNTQFVHNLMGNTQITRDVRQVTESVNPKNHAIWTLGRLYEHLCQWAYEVYDTDEHPALFESPRDAFASGMLLGGNRVQRIIPYDENFLMLTLPTTPSGLAKVQTGSGVKINYIYYWNNVFRSPEIENTRVPVRYDPFDLGTAYAFVQGQWVHCVSQYYADFQGKSEKELKLATAEIRKRHSNHAKQSIVSAKKLAEFLASLEAQEVLLSQRMRDTEASVVFQLIQGGKATSQENDVNVQSKVIEMNIAYSQTIETTAVAVFDELEVYEEL